MEGILALMIPIVTVVSIFTWLIVLRSYDNKERLSMIDKGMNPADAKTGPRSGVLVFAGLLIGGGVGLLLGNFLDATFGMEEVAYFSMLFICGGIGLIFGRKLALQEEKKNA